MTGSDLIVLAPWVVFAVLLAVVLVRLLRTRPPADRPPADRPPTADRAAGTEESPPPPDLHPGPTPAARPPENLNSVSHSPGKEQS